MSRTEIFDNLVWPSKRIATSLCPEMRELLESLGLEDVVEFSFESSVHSIPLIKITKQMTTGDLEKFTDYFNLHKLAPIEEDSEETRPG